MFRCFSSWKGWVILAAAVLIGGYLVIWHQQHVAVVLPLLVFMACPLMHVLSHHTHDHSREDVSRKRGEGAD